MRLVHRRGLTLVEVVVSLVLAATLLVGMLTAFRVHRQQMVRAVRQRAALRTAEALLSGWKGAEIPRQGQGRVSEGTQTWMWRTRPLRSHPLAEGISVETIRFEMYAADRRQRPVLTVELLRPADVRPPADRPGAKRRGGSRGSFRK